MAVTDQNKKKLINAEGLHKAAEVILGKVNEKDEAVKGLVTAEATTRGQEITRVEGLVSAEAKRAGEKEAELVAEDARIEGLVTAEATTRGQEIERVEGLVSTEKERAELAEQGLQAAIDAIEESLADGTVAGKISDLEQGLEDAVAAIGVNEQAIADEKSARETAVQTLTTNLGTANQNIGDLQTRMSAAEGDITTNGNNIAKEITDRKAADTALDNRLKAAEGTIVDHTGLLEGLRTDVNKAQTDASKGIADAAAEKERAEGAEAELLGKINKEIGDRGKEITRVEDLVSTEKGRAEAKEGELAQAIVDAQTELEKAIGDEEKRALAAEQGLQGAINGVSGRVGTLEGKVDVVKVSEAIAAAKQEALTAVNTLKTTEVAANAAAISGVDARLVTAEEAITKLNGPATEDGSVAKAVADGIAGVVAGADTKFDTLKEIADWIANDQTGAASLSNRVAANEQAIEGLEKDLADEVAAARAAEKANAEAIVQMGKDYVAADTALHTTISAEIDTDVKVEADRAKGEEAKIRGEFAAADTALHTTISAEIGAAVKVEADRAKGAEKANADAIAVLNGEGEGSVKAAVKAEEERAMGAEQGLQSAINGVSGRVGTLEGKVDVEKVSVAVKGAKDYADQKVKALADGAVKENADAIAGLNTGVADLRSDVVNTFKALKLQFNEAAGTVQLALVSNQMDGEVTTPIQNLATLPVMTTSDVESLLGDLQ